MSRKNTLQRNKISERLEQVRKSKNLKQPAFAKILGTRASTISDIETGKNMPGGKFLIALKSAFPELDLNWLLCGEGEMFLQSLGKEGDAQRKLDEIREIIERK